MDSRKTSEQREPYRANARYNPNRIALNLTGMKPRERKAYLLWIGAEEEQMRRIKGGRTTPEMNKYHDKLNKLTMTICGKV